MFVLVVCGVCVGVDLVLESSPVHVQCGGAVRDAHGAMADVKVLPVGSFADHPSCVEDLVREPLLVHVEDLVCEPLLVDIQGFLQVRELQTACRLKSNLGPSSR